MIVGGGGQLHTFGMLYAIDVLFCDRDWVVLHVVRGLRPNRLTRWVRYCRYVVELRSGAVPDNVVRGTGLAVRDRPA